jgi:hypothetical protein
MSNPASCSPEDCVEPGTDGSDSQLSAEQSPSTAKERKPVKARVGSAVSEPLLPPCRVCGEKASGFHYGANTCEACKV